MAQQIMRITCKFLFFQHQHYFLLSVKGSISHQSCITAKPIPWINSVFQIWLPTNGDVECCTWLGARFCIVEPHGTASLRFCQVLCHSAQLNHFPYKTTKIKLCHGVLISSTVVSFVCSGTFAFHVLFPSLWASIQTTDCLLRATLVQWMGMTLPAKQLCLLFL